jgi:xanthine dehydrogenase/oxidase
MEGVVGYYGAGDVPGDNMIGPVKHDEEVFATKEVTCVGQVRGFLGEGRGFRRGFRAWGRGGG